MKTMFTTKRAQWGPELDTTTTCRIRHYEVNVYNIEKTWALAMQSAPLRGICVRRYGGTPGLRSVVRYYKPGSLPPRGLQCDFSQQVVSRGNGYTVVTRSPLHWSVLRGSEGRNPKTDAKYLPGGAEKLAADRGDKVPFLS
jgi:hypothetical protein